jgi:hypothetical protein
MRRLLTICALFSSALVYGQDGSRITNHNSQAIEIVTCVRDTFQMSSLNNTSVEDVRALLRILNGMFAPEADLVRLTADCKAIYDAHVNSNKDTVASIIAFFKSRSRTGIETGVNPKSSWWIQQINEGGAGQAASQGGTILSGIVQPIEDCQKTVLAGATGVTVNALSCRTTAGYAYNKIDGHFGLGLVAGCAASPVFSKSLNLYFAASPDDWSLVLPPDSSAK